MRAAAPIVIATSLVLAGSGCTSGEFSGWPTNCTCRLSRASSGPRVDVACPDGNGDGRGLSAGVPTTPYVQGWFHGSLVVLRAGQDVRYVEGVEALTEFGARVEHEGRPMYPVAVHRAYFPPTEGFDLDTPDLQSIHFAESRLENATFWCEDADAT